MVAQLPTVPTTPTAEEAFQILSAPLTAEEEMELDSLPSPVEDASTHNPVAVPSASATESSVPGTG